ncbi:MAG TPA: hypothetical protein VK498_06425 [Ferruginibacter sp.]|nr:hypothetical protein [Ferruginibacter sp.]
MSEENKNTEDGSEADGKARENNNEPGPGSGIELTQHSVPQTPNIQPEMETHAHHLHHAPGKKTWHYFYEFLMLFLAVFCGFLAEYQLEHIIEHQREDQYMESLLKDLSSDTLTISTAIPRKLTRVRCIDTVFTFFITHPGSATIPGHLFKTIRKTNYDYRVTRNTITINQLKNAGGMRLVRNREVADSISSYDLRFENVNLYFDYYATNSLIGARQFEKLFNALDLLPLYLTNTSPAIVDNIPDSLVIRINTEGMNEVLNFMMQEKAYAYQELNRYQDLRQRAIRLMELIRKEYNMD